MRSSLLFLLLGGCDLVFGVNGPADPCSPGSFDGAPFDELAAAEDFSVDWDQTFAILSRQTGAYELRLDGGEQPIDLGVYVNSGFALAPEGNAMFYTAMTEPPLLQGALRTGDATWAPSHVLPRGYFAGTPSADVFGPRRVLVTVDKGLQEVEDDAGRWVAVGEPHLFDGVRAPNLTPDGLTAVYTGSDGIYAMSRTSIETWFDAPVKLLGGADHSPQLLGRCKRLYTVHDDIVRRYQR